MDSVPSPASDEIFEQLELILQSGDFKKSQRLRKFLSYVVRQTVEDGAEFIRSYNIAVEAFGKGADFDPADPYVRNIARLVRKALRKYYKNAGSDSTVRIDVPAGNYIATFARQQGPSARSTSSDIVVSQNALVLEPVRELPSIAVIPLRYLGAKDAKEFVIGEVVAANVIAGLSASPLMNVISRLSTTQYRDLSWQPGELFERLNADYVVSGSYYCVAGRAVVTIELAKTRTLDVMWTEYLRCHVDELIHDDEVYDGLLNKVAKAVMGAVLSREYQRAATEPMSGLDLYTKLLGGVYHMHSGKFDLARDLLADVVARQPQQATAHARLAQWYMLKLNRSGGWSQKIDANDKNKVVEHCTKALEVNSGHALGLTMKGLIETHMHRDPDLGLETYKAACKTNPNEPLVYACQAAALSYQEGQGQQAVAAAKKMFQLSPLDPQLSLFHTCAAAAYYAAGNINKAASHAKCGYKLNPDHTSNLRTLAAVQVERGKMTEAEKIVKKLLSSDPGFTTSSYRSRSPSAMFSIGEKIASNLEIAGVPKD